MIRRPVIVLVTLFSIAGLSGCATVSGDTEPQKITIQCNPDGADIEIRSYKTSSTIFKGKAPSETYLERIAGYGADSGETDQTN